MKKITVLVLVFFLISNSSFFQLEVYVDTIKNDSPNESWNVNKSFDKNGNIVQYDSSYSYSYSSTGEYLNIDSLITNFGINNFFSNPFDLDSSFNFHNQKSKMMENFFNEFMEIDSFFNDLFDNYFSKPVPRKKNKGTHI
ncbi:MAG: hypothetical protein CL827_00200 [Crocinitomicaceae bacterium]|nr:hypothetical protein [Crocinitomicaceae bacterium]